MNVTAAIMAIFLLLAPDKAYVKPEEPVMVRFLQSSQPQAALSQNAPAPVESVRESSGGGWRA